MALSGTSCYSRAFVNIAAIARYAFCLTARPSTKSRQTRALVAYTIHIQPRLPRNY
ncbi:hypothetical protein BJX65DRAFT_282740 [Aspergillus insuetus]